jgi:small subunit ribosomal protein S20
MANHKSAKKRIRQTEAKRVHNKYFHKTMRNALKKLRSTENQEEAQGIAPSLISLIDKLAKKNIIHKNKAANLKSSVTVKLNSLAK